MTPAVLLASVKGAEADARAAILQELYARKGAEATQALTQAVEAVPQESRGKALDLLTRRMTRMTAATLERYLAAEQPALQAAAARAVGLKGEKSMAGKLVSMLRTPDDTVANSAQAALRQLSGQDFGEFERAGGVERFLIIKKWEAWRRKTSAADGASPP